MILSDESIENQLGHTLEIKPFNFKQLQPSSYDLKLSRNFWLMLDELPDFSSQEAIDAWTVDLIDPGDVDEIGIHISVDELTIRPGEFVLGSTEEQVKVSPYLVARLEGKSSLGRLGLIVHATAGYIDPNFNGHLTLELVNVGSRPLRLHAGMEIAQITFIQLSSRPKRFYGDKELGSRYQDQGIKPVPFIAKKTEIPAGQTEKID